MGLIPEKNDLTFIKLVLSYKMITSIIETLCHVMREICGIITLMVLTKLYLKWRQGVMEVTEYNDN